MTDNTQMTDKHRKPHFGDIDCKNQADQDSLVTKHDAKTEVAFQAMLTRFFGNNVPNDFTRMERDDIRNLISDPNIDCAHNRLRFEMDETDTTTNTGITVTPEEFQGFRTYYSIALFRGVDRKFTPDYYEFYKAIDDKNKLTIAFRVINNNQVVYRGDLSNEYP